MHFPQAEFAPERNQVEVDLEAILDDLRASKIDGSIAWVWDGVSTSHSVRGNTGSSAGP